jgi:hypothetical protein
MFIIQREDGSYQDMFGRGTADMSNAMLYETSEEANRWAAEYCYHECNQKWSIVTLDDELNVISTSQQVTDSEANEWFQKQREVWA